VSVNCHDLLMVMFCIMVRTA